MEFTYRNSRRRAALRREGKMTTAEYLATEETLLPCELAYGVLRVAEAPGAPHQRIVGRIFLAMTAVIDASAAGEVLLSPMDVILDYDRALVVQPDLMFISTAREAIVKDRIYGAPDVVVEVLSPHPRIGSLNERVGWFAKYGVRECWLADLPKQKYAILVLNERGIVEQRLCSPGDAARSDVLRGVILPSLAA